MKIHVWPFIPPPVEWKPAKLTGVRASLRGLVTWGRWGLALVHQLPSVPPPPPGLDPHKAGVIAGIMEASTIALRKSGQAHTAGSSDLCLGFSILASDIQMRASELRREQRGQG